MLILLVVVTFKQIYRALQALPVKFIVFGNVMLITILFSLVGCHKTFKFLCIVPHILDKNSPMHKKKNRLD